MIPRKKIATSLNNINRLVFVLELLCVFGKIRINCLYQLDAMKGNTHNMCV